MKYLSLTLSHIFLLLSLLFISSVSIAKSYWDEFICGWSVAGSQQEPGNRFVTEVSVGAQRNETSNIPVNFYFSPSPSVTSSSQYLGRATATVNHPGAFCSDDINTTLIMPTRSIGKNCMDSTSAYIVFKTGDSEKASTVYLTPGGRPLPEITSFIPTSGTPGTEVTITGSGFDNNTSVLIGGVEAPKITLISSTQIKVMIPRGASTNKITVKRVGPGYQFCTSPDGTSENEFIVYCESGASFNGYGRVEYVASTEFVNNLTGSGSCPNYSDYANFVSNALIGELKRTLVQFDSCGTPDYAKLFKAYVDWNRDGDFVDPGEFLIDAPLVKSDTMYALDTTIPDSAAIGQTRMRLILALYYSGSVDSSSDVDSCAIYPLGETQDYTLNISMSSGEMRAFIDPVQPVWTLDGTEPLILKANPPSESPSIENLIPRDALHGFLVPDDTQ